MKQGIETVNLVLKESILDLPSNSANLLEILKEKTRNKERQLARSRIKSTNCESSFLDYRVPLPPLNRISDHIEENECIRVESYAPGKENHPENFQDELAPPKHTQISKKTEIRPTPPPFIKEDFPSLGPSPYVPYLPKKLRYSRAPNSSPKRPRSPRSYSMTSEDNDPATIQKVKFVEEKEYKKDHFCGFDSSNIAYDLSELNTTFQFPSDLEDSFDDKFRPLPRISLSFRNLDKKKAYFASKTPAKKGKMVAVCGQKRVPSWAVSKMDLKIRLKTQENQVLRDMRRVRGGGVGRYDKVNLNAIFGQKAQRRS